MSVMVQFSNPTFGSLVDNVIPKVPDPSPVVLGPFEEARIEDGCVYAADESIGYYDCSENVWMRDGKPYGEMKIFAAPSVVST